MDAGKYDVTITRNIVIDRWWLNSNSDFLARVVFDTDPLTDKIECSVYTEDGKGNGNRIFGFSVDEESNEE